MVKGKYVPFPSPCHVLCNVTVTKWFTTLQLNFWRCLSCFDTCYFNNADLLWNEVIVSAVLYMYSDVHVLFSNNSYAPNIPSISLESPNGWASHPGALLPAAIYHKMSFLSLRTGNWRGRNKWLASPCRRLLRESLLPSCLSLKCFRASRYDFILCFLLMSYLSFQTLLII